MESRFRGPLNRLRALGDAWAEIFEAQGERPSIIRTFVATRDPLELPRVLPLALSLDQEVAQSAAAAIHDYLSQRAPRELVLLDDALRASYCWSAESPWQHVRPEDVSKLSALGEHAAGALGLPSYHPSGYVREAAVHALAEIRSGNELPFLLIRVNDWVHAVQDAAYRAVTARLIPDYAAHLVAALWLVARLERCARADHAALLERVRRLLAAPESRPALLEATGAADLWLRRMCYRLLFAAKTEVMPDVVCHALEDEDAVIRLWAAEQAEGAFDLPELREVLASMSRDSFMPVRREALRMWVKHFPAVADQRLHEALLDRHATIREVARFHVKKRGSVDVPVFYRSRLGEDSGQVLRAAIHGVGEAGSAEDTELIEPYLSHSSPGIRKAAVVALSRIAAVRSVPHFLRALEDPSPGVSRAARQALSSRETRVPGNRLWEIFECNADVHVRINALSLLASLGKWEGISWMIRACAAGEERVTRAGRQHVQQWIERFNRNQSQPTGDQLDRMARALDESPPGVFDEEKERLLRFLMKGF